MQLDLDKLSVKDNPAESRYEAAADGRLAVAEYRLAGDQIIFTHTEVPEEMAGTGVGSKLVQAALDDARARGLTVVPQCPFVAAYIKRHPAYRDLVAPEG